MKKCDYMKVDEEYPMCYADEAEGIYGFVVREECYSRICYTNKKEKRKQKLEKINKLTNYEKM